MELKEDKVILTDIEAVVELIRGGELVNVVERAVKNALSKEQSAVMRVLGAL